MLAAGLTAAAALPPSSASSSKIDRAALPALVLALAAGDVLDVVLDESCVTSETGRGAGLFAGVGAAGSGWPATNAAKRALAAATCASAFVVAISRRANQRRSASTFSVATR